MSRILKYLSRIQQVTIFALLFVVECFAVEAATPAATSVSVDAPFIDFKQFTAQYCNDCHNSKERKGKLDLQSLLKEGFNMDAETRKAVLWVLQEREMPPEDEPDIPRPKQSEYAAAMAFLESKAAFDEPAVTPFLAALESDFAHSEIAPDESFFLRTLYPAMYKVQCHRCHNDNGVASDTMLRFPGEQANVEQVAAFGLKLMDLIDRENLQQSPLFLKSTNREEHTGGVRIKPGSEEEQALLHWMKHLAELSDEEIRAARERIAQAEKSSLGKLAVRRLSHSQYNHTVRDLLQDQTLPANRFPKEDFVRGFKNQTEGLGISPLQAEAYGKAAERLAVAAFRGGDHLGLLPREPSSLTDERCAKEFVEQFGLKAFRRPLTEEESTVYTTLFLADAARTGDYLSGGRIVVEAMLQSPHFLFRVERGPDSPFAQYELASRLSYFLWDTMPSEAMLQAAGAGELASAEQVEFWARRLLEDPRAKTAMEEFLAQWVRFDRVLEATRSRRYREFNGEVAAAMMEETTRLFNHLVWDDQNFMEFYTADYTFLSTELAKIYDMPPPSSEFARVSYPVDSGRAGVLGHGSFLVATSKPSETSPTERGLFVRNHFLSHEVPAPPPGVSTSLPEISEDKPMTNRERLAIHLNSEACASCHRLIDPIGFGFEQYNPIGSFQKQMSLVVGSGREGKEIELDLDTSASIQGIANSDFSTPKELGRVLAESEASQRAIVKQLFRYAFGRQETLGDRPVIDAALSDFRNANYRFRELIVSLVTSELFLQKGED